MGIALLRDQLDGLILLERQNGDSMCGTEYVRMFH